MPGRPVDVCTTRRSVLDVGGPVALLVLIADKIGLKRNSCVCLCKRERERECVCKYLERKFVFLCVCVCVCVCVREREGVCV